MIRRQKKSQLTLNNLIVNLFHFSEYRLFQFYLFLMQIINPLVALEIGAFKAEFSENVRKQNKDIKLYAFEASKYNYQHISERKDFKTMNINYLNFAISDSDGEVEFMIQKEKIDTNEKFDQIRNNNSFKKRLDKNINYENLKVPSYTLDTFLTNEKLLNLTTALWVDVEGANKEIILGGATTLNQVLLIHIEVEERAYWENQWLDEDIKKELSKYNLVPFARDRERDNGQYNFIFIKKEIHDKISSTLFKKIVLNFASLGRSRINNIILRLNINWI